MKTKNHPKTTVLKLILIGSVLCFTTVAHAGLGTNSGGGGGGIVSGDHVYVVDLVEAGVESQPFFDPSVPSNKDFSSRISQALSSVPNVPVDLISQKLNEIYAQYDHLLPEEIIVTLETFDWQMLDFTLTPIPDEHQVVNIPPQDQVQLAARIDGAVKLDSHLWSKLDAPNKAALIIHEAVYALVQTRSSDDARSVVGYLFSQDLKSRKLSGFKNIINGRLDFQGVDQKILACSPDNSTPDCMGQQGYAVLSSGYFLASHLDLKRMRNANIWSAFNDNGGINAPVITDARDLQDLPNALGYSDASKSGIGAASQDYCSKLVNALSSTYSVFQQWPVDDTSGLIASTSKDITGIWARVGYQAEVIAWDLDPSGRFISPEQPKFIEVQVGLEKKWSNGPVLNEVSCMSAEATKAAEALSRMNEMYK